MREEFQNAANRQEGERQQLIAALTPEQKKAFDAMQERHRAEQQHLIREQDARRQQDIEEKKRRIRDEQVAPRHKPKGMKTLKPNVGKEAKKRVKIDNLQELNNLEKRQQNEERDFLKKREHDRLQVKENQAPYTASPSPDKSRNQRLAEAFKKVADRRNNNGHTHNKGHEK